jgi:pantoate--beta-alanine ligase
MKAAPIVTTTEALRARLSAWRKEGARIGLVPTMGALHTGHLSLVEQIRNHADRAVVSIFVNPAQFAPHEDFDRYPRALEADVEKLGAAADLVFAPSVREMYPDGFATRIEVGGPSAGLETDFRPHFFAGVATVVAKLLIAAMPDAAIFGEKDYQQLLVIRRLTADLGLPIRILGAPIVREADGLAMSSRNAYLGTRERAVAGRMNVILRAASLRDGVAAAEAAARAALLAAGFDPVDYVAIRDAATLGPAGEGPKRILAAAKIGTTRLIDNMDVA